MKPVDELPWEGIDLAASAKEYGLRIERCEACGQEEMLKIEEPTKPCWRCKLNKQLGSEK